MKTFLLALVAILGTLGLFAQRHTDLKVTLISPAAGTIYHAGDTMKLKIELKNLDTASWVVNDSIAWQFSLITGSYLLKVNRVVSHNDTLLLNFKVPVTIDTNLTTNACAAALFINQAGPNQIVDNDSTNNKDCHSITFAKNAPVAINDVNATIKSLTVFPNPANNEIAFNCDDFTNKAFDVRIMDITGRLIIAKHYDQNSIKKVTIQDLSNGIYQINIIQDGQKYIGKFAKQQ